MGLQKHCQTSWSARAIEVENMKAVSQFQFTKEQQHELRATLKGYFFDELEMGIGDLQADLFLEFLNKKIGREYYNLGVMDTIKAMKEKTEDLVLLIKE